MLFPSAPTGRTRAHRRVRRGAERGFSATTRIPVLREDRKTARAPPSRAPHAPGHASQAHGKKKRAPDLDRWGARAEPRGSFSQEGGLGRRVLAPRWFRLSGVRRSALRDCSVTSEGELTAAADDPQPERT